jgi:hypothetical protein
VKTTNAWLITNGLNVGMAKVVGDTVREGQNLEWHETAGILDTISCIGVTPWSAVSRNHQAALLNNDLNVRCISF